MTYRRRAPPPGQPRLTALPCAIATEAVMAAATTAAAAAPPPGPGTRLPRSGGQAATRSASDGSQDRPRRTRDCTTTTSGHQKTGGEGCPQREGQRPHSLHPPVLGASYRTTLVSCTVIVLYVARQRTTYSTTTESHQLSRSRRNPSAATPVASAVGCPQGQHRPV